MAVGSQRVLRSDDAAQESFELRKHAPNALLLSNLGAVQLNYDMGFADCEAVLDVLEADGLCLHLNPLQEAVQPGGDTDFSTLRSKISVILQTLKKPVVIKEVGPEFPRKTLNIYWRQVSSISMLPGAAGHRGAKLKVIEVTILSWVSCSVIGVFRRRWRCG